MTGLGAFSGVRGSGGSRGASGRRRALGRFWRALAADSGGLGLARCRLGW